MNSDLLYLCKKYGFKQVNFSLKKYTFRIKFNFLCESPLTADESPLTAASILIVCKNSYSMSDYYLFIFFCNKSRQKLIK